jgi:thiamine-phosphate pyrophosphorylase
VITDTSTQARFAHAELAELAIDGGADTIQFRDKTLASAAAIATAKRIGDICRKAGVTFIVNDRLDIALASRADGVHLGRGDLPIAAARRILGPTRLIGGSASTLEQAREVQAAGADYVGFGHVFPTASKAKPGQARGPESLRAMRALSIPVIAIGGIDTGNLAQVLDTGVWGVAVIRAVCGAEDPETVAGRIASAIRAWHAARSPESPPHRVTREESPS